MPMGNKLHWVKTLRQFSGKANLAGDITSGGADPYAAIPAEKQ